MIIVDKQYRVNLYRTDIKEYKKQKRLEWYDDNKIRHLAQNRRKDKEYRMMEKRMTPERKAKRSIINRIYREKVKQK